MAIKSGVPIDRVEMINTDDYTVTSSSTTETKEVYSLIFHDHGGSGANIELFLSGDASSSSAERVDYIQLSANETALSQPVAVGSGQFLIAKSSAANINYHGAYTVRNGGDV